MAGYRNLCGWSITLVFVLLLFRSGIKKVIQLLIQVRSLDKAKLAAAEHSMDEVVRDV